LLQVPKWNSSRTRRTIGLPSSVATGKRAVRPPLALGHRDPSRTKRCVAAAEREAGIEDGAGIVVARRRLIDARQQLLAAAIVDLVENDAVAAARIERTQNEEIGLIFDKAARVPRRLVEIGDRPVLCKSDTRAIALRGGQDRHFAISQNHAPCPLPLRYWRQAWVSFTGRPFSFISA
jgi:hypothetical protein